MGKRNRFKIFLCFGMATLLLSGCFNAPTISGNPFSTGTTENALNASGNGTETVTPVTGATDTVTSDVNNVDSSGSESTVPEYLAKEHLDEVALQQKEKFCFQALSEKEQVLYTQILEILNHYGEEQEIETIDETELAHVFQCVLLDHPEIFWVDGYSFIRRKKGDQDLNILLSGQYTYTSSEVTSYRFQIDQYVSSATVGLQTASDYKKSKAVYEYIIHHTEYKIGAKDNQNILSVMLYGESVCQGYAKTYQYLMEYLGIPCTVIVGATKDGESHAWNLVKLDGDYYYVDVTWGDASYLSSSYMSAQMPSIGYGFLNITTADLNKSHVIQHEVDVPVCTATADNYFVKENRIFYLVNDADLSTLFATAYQNGEETISLKCSDEFVYAQMKKRLLDDQAIFGFLQGTTSVNYVEDEDSFILTFWL